MSTVNTSCVKHRNKGMLSNNILLLNPLMSLVFIWLKHNTASATNLKDNAVSEEAHGGEIERKKKKFKTQIQKAGLPVTKTSGLSNKKK